METVSSMGLLNACSEGDKGSAPRRRWLCRPGAFPHTARVCLRPTKQAIGGATLLAVAPW